MRLEEALVQARQQSGNALSLNGPSTLSLRCDAGNALETAEQMRSELEALRSEQVSLVENGSIRERSLQNGTLV